MGVILQVALPSRELAAARLQCGAAGAGASRGLGVCAVAEHARLAARGESARAMEIGDFLGRLGPGGNSQCVAGRYAATAARYAARRLVPRIAAPCRGHVVVWARRYARRRPNHEWPRRSAATRHRYGVPVQSLFMKPSKRTAAAKPAL